MQRTTHETQQNNAMDSSSSDDDNSLGQKFKHVQHDWDAIKTTHPRRRRRRPLLRPYSTQVNSPQSLDYFFDPNSPLSFQNLFNTSPRDLVSSLQRNKPSPSFQEWKIRTNELAIIDLLEQRREGFDSGRIRGRDLFEALEGVSSTGSDEFSSSSSSFVHRESHESLCSYSSLNGGGGDGGDDGYVSDGDDDDEACSLFSSSSICVKEKKRLARVGDDDCTERENDDGRKCLGLMGWAAVVVMIFAFCVISLSCFGGDEEEYYEDRRVLFPT